MFTRNSRGAARVLAAAVVSFCVAVAAGCSKDLSRGQAADLIKSHKDLKSTRDRLLPVGRFWYTSREINDDFDHQALAGAGLLTIRETQKYYAFKEYLVELTPAGQAAAGAWVKTSEVLKLPFTFFNPAPFMRLGTPTTVYRIQVAERRLVGVTGIVSDPSGKLAQVEFTWKWAATPQAKLVPTLAPSEDAHSGAASFQLYDDGWRIQTVAFQ